MISQRTSEAVVLLRGLAAKRLAKLRLAKHLTTQSFHVENWGYPSIRSSIERHAHTFSERLKQFETSQPQERVHIVTHSMGGIIARRAISLYRPSKLGRFVMLGPRTRGHTLLESWRIALGEEA